FVIAGLPVLSLIQFWGGIDIVLIAGNLAGTMLNILTIGSICLLVSVVCKTVAGAVLASYALIVPVCLCCAGATQGFPLVLQDVRQSGQVNMSVQDLGALAIMHLLVSAVCVALAIAALRERDMPLPFEPAVGNPPPKVIKAKVEAEKPPTPLVSPDVFASYPLPPVSDHALLWKECHLGGPTVLQILFRDGFPQVAAIGAVVAACCVLSFAFPRDSDRSGLRVAGVLVRAMYDLLLSC